MSPENNRPEFDRYRTDSEKTWTEYRQLILSELERLQGNIIDLGNKIDRNYHDYQTEISKIKIDVAMLQVKSGVWGAVAGLLVTLAAVFLRFIGNLPHV